MIGAVVLAAGRSQRMGLPKMTLPWGETTVIGQVVRVLEEAAVPEIVVVTGGASETVEAALAGTSARTTFNAKFENGEMTRSLQVGLEALPEMVEAALVVLGDQPHIELQVVQAVQAAYRNNRIPLAVPSFRRRRGHPWLVSRFYWDELRQLAPPATLRDFLNRHQSDTFFVEVDTPTVRFDLDTPEDYRRFHPSLPDS